MKTIPIYYRLAPRRNIAPDVLVAQAIVETGRGHYGNSRPWNMAGIKKGGEVGDAPRDFEVPRPPTRASGCTSTTWPPTRTRGPIGEPHDRFYDARAAQKARGWWVRRISQLGNGIWAGNLRYARKIRDHLTSMGSM
jgi:hypothetical protein